MQHRQKEQVSGRHRASGEGADIAWEGVLAGCLKIATVVFSVTASIVVLIFSMLAALMRLILFVATTYVRLRQVETTRDLIMYGLPDAELPTTFRHARLHQGTPRILEPEILALRDRDVLRRDRR